MFRRVLIANRGEIATRVAKTCRRLGVEPVFAYSEADRDSAWIKEAEHSICIGPAPASESYLSMDRLIQAAIQMECQALHPGYGFLSENPIFAARLTGSGITLIGPSSEIMRRMGDKSTAKQTMKAAGLPVVPGSESLITSPEAAADLANDMGYPVLLKATAGGGGKGMRRCDGEDEVKAAFEAASAEAAKSFGNAGLYLEKFLEGGRHVEFQIMADQHGQAVCFGERECSIQRKHQKLIEESPAPGIDPKKLKSMGEKVARAVSAIGYQGAGTVEFLHAPNGEMYFMEMNARLQVEHPVTEMCHQDLDLVEWQLRVACGEKLPQSLLEKTPSGHAMEFRINAEDPSEDFKPSPGLIETLHVPDQLSDTSLTLRWDSAIVAGSRVPPHYDSMIGKWIIHGPTREKVIDAAIKTLSEMKISGVESTIELHKKILARPEFRKGELDVKALERWLHEGH